MNLLRFFVLLLLPLHLQVLADDTAHAQVPTRRAFDFGPATSAEKGYAPVTAQTLFTAQSGFGWLETTQLQTRDRPNADALRRDFVWSTRAQAHTFRIAGLKNGLYRLQIICGDFTYGDHLTRIRIENGAQNWPILRPAIGEFETLSATVEVKNRICDIVFDSPNQNWIVNALTLEPTTQMSEPQITRQQLSAASTWQPLSQWPDPISPLLKQFRSEAPRVAITPTQLKNEDYLQLIAGEIDFWKTQQNAQGAIIDPYRKAEFQYSTPAFAHAAAALVAWHKRDDLLESAALAMDWSVRSLSTRTAANAHEDFYPPMIAHAFSLLKPRVEAARAARWESELRTFSASKTYRVAPGANNWNLVALAGEAMFGKMGLRDERDFIERSLAAQGRHFASGWGLYLEGPLAYDLFPRLWLADMLANGYDGAYRAQAQEHIDRSALSSLWMQSPSGEWPAGGRSAHHQWNEAQQCVIFEIYAARAGQAGDALMASAYKRAAHLALASMKRWVRPSGEMQIVKNWVDPAQNHAFESYSAHSQYNLLPMSMLAIAFQHAQSTPNVVEKAAPSDVGGFVLNIEPLHKIIANAGGHYVEIDTLADPKYDATGLIRVHSRGVSPQLGPSDSVLANPAYRRPTDSPMTANTSISVAWQDGTGKWRRIGELGKTNITKSTLMVESVEPNRVRFKVRYEGELLGVSQIEESYDLSPTRLQLTTQIPNYKGSLRLMWPILADDGRTKSQIAIAQNTLSVSQDGGKSAQTFTAIGAQTVRIEPDLLANHNGWAQIAVAEFAAGETPTLIIAPRVSK